MTMCCLMFALTMQAQTNGKPHHEKKQAWPSFLTKEQVPDGVKFLPAPPDTASVQYLYDFSQYQWGKSIRNTPRGEQAAQDADLSLDAVCGQFAEAMGFVICRERTPELYALMEHLVTDGGNAVRTAKNYYKRRRPYVQFHETTNVPKHEESYKKTYSYPSGHSSRGWCVALVLAEINTDRQEAILKRGYEIGQSRVIAGYHYQSDVDVARLAASAVVARLHADEGFQKQLARAKKEFAKMKAN